MTSRSLLALLLACSWLLARGACADEVPPSWSVTAPETWPRAAGTPAAAEWTVPAAGRELKLRLSRVARQDLVQSRFDGLRRRCGLPPGDDFMKATHAAPCGAGEYRWTLVAGSRHAGLAAYFLLRGTVYELCLEGDPASIQALEADFVRMASSMRVNPAQVPWLEAAAAAAAKGKTEAATDLALALLGGQVDGNDPSAAGPILEGAAAMKDLRAQKILAGLLRRGGPGIPRDVGRALKLYAALSDAGDLEAQTAAGEILLDGEDQQRDESLGLRILMAAAAAGEPQACYRIGRIRTAQGSQDVAAGLKLLEQAVAQGHASAQVHLGRLLRAGVAVPRDDGRAEELFLRAGRSGEPAAFLELGQMYLGKGDEVSMGGAWMAFAAADALGDPGGGFFLGLMSMEGRGVPQNRELGLQCWQAAASEGSTQAQIALGMVAEKGADRAKALSYYRHAGDSGDPEGDCRAGAILLRSSGQEVEEGLLRLQRAAAVGHVQAARILAAQPAAGRKADGRQAQ